MRVDRLNPRTWLIGAVAAWALLFLVLTLAGLGGRIGQREDEGDPSAVTAPAMPDVAPQPPLSQYGEIAARPLFSADRKPHPFFIDPQDEGGEAAPGFDFVLTSVLLTPDFAMAILQPSGGGESIRLRIGEAPPTTPGWVLGSVDARSVVFNGPEGPRTLELRVFDGTGGQPPTPMTTPVAQDRAVQMPLRRPPPATDPPPPDIPQAGDAGRAQARNAARNRAPSGGAQTAGNDVAATAEAQVEAIRRRIEERRARLRQEQQQQQQQPARPSPAPQPSPTPVQDP
ncbi:general secretion pathway protein GspN [Luteimonas sp. RC10]|uniref:general secretion pathway protein GspN n=1 Tax=Luteimonas sp. RC10 TaxID=2587035 RepID=UPI001620B516|nr:general secretion pathway protein GspN [Luteimonas sp. RC10]MBB3345489.1 general secretion pathway protein N [Luteimonas sp. RC10]